jgi:hypothetical protein
MTASAAANAVTKTGAWGTNIFLRFIDFIFKPAAKNDDHAL